MVRKNPECVNFLDKEKQTPLHIAAQCGCLEAVRIILSSQCKPDVNAKSVSISDQHL